SVIAFLPRQQLCDISPRSGPPATAFRIFRRATERDTGGGWTHVSPEGAAVPLVPGTGAGRRQPADRDLRRVRALVRPGRRADRDDRDPDHAAPDRVLADRGSAPQPRAGTRHRSA